MANTENGDEAPPPDSFVREEAGLKYWGGINATVDGMLGGYPQVSRIDLQGSRNFLAKLGIANKPGHRTVETALEGGAGIGRITDGLLLQLAEEVDVIEPVAKFTAALQGRSGVRDIFNVGLQDWRPTREGDEAEYGLIWVQWCVGHLTDAQLVAYLVLCKTVLRRGGLIVVKENLSTSGVDLFDAEDSAVTREDAKFLSIFEQAGLRVVKAEVQRGFPKVLFPVKMYALKPADR